MAIKLGKISGWVVAGILGLVLLANIDDDKELIIKPNNLLNQTIDKAVSKPTETKPSPTKPIIARQLPKLKPNNKVVPKSATDLVLI
ncbi:MAG: hypothetical protein HRU28_11965 [Rhizobiales bacterium]|nr:hypothetical protein [Hyphomicrobiales bacterium]